MGIQRRGAAPHLKEAVDWRGLPGPWILTSLEPLDAATSLAARSMGLETETGALATGLAADITAVDGDPLRDVTALTRIVFVMKSRVVYRNSAAALSVR